MSYRKLTKEQKQQKEKQIQIIKEYFIQNSTTETRRLLAKEKRKIAACLEEMKEAEKAINMKKDFTINEFCSYAYKVNSMPIDSRDDLVKIYQSSLLMKQSIANGKKCAQPKVKFLNGDGIIGEEDLRKYNFREKVTLQIEVEAGARILMTTDGKFPESGYVGTEIIIQSHCQRTFNNHCILRLKAEKDGQIQSKCVSFELIPEETGDLHKIMNGVRKAEFRYDDSNEIQQSDIVFNL